MKQIWIAFASGNRGRWHNYWRWRIGMWLHRRSPAVWRFLKYGEKAKEKEV
jgi:hypothetical protein